MAPAAGMRCASSQYEFYKADATGTLTMQLSVFRVPCSVFRVPCSVFRVPCSVFRVPCSVFRVPCSVFRVPCSVFRVPCSVFRVPCSVFRVPCSVLSFSSRIRSRSRCRTDKSIVGSEPASAEEEAGTERGEENRLAFAARLSRGGVQTGVEGRAAHGRAEIARSFRDGRKGVRGNTALFCEECNETWIRLMRGKTSDGSSRDAAAQLHGGENFLHARDGGARKSFAVKLHVEASVLGIGHLDHGSEVTCATK